MISAINIANSPYFEDDQTTPDHKIARVNGARKMPCLGKTVHHERAHHVLIQYHFAVALLLALEVEIANAGLVR